jgi:hypothetical protein
MSGVVLRCPNCGTTRAAPGECDACHEAPVRYYCTQHRPGLWLDAPTCGQCGSRFGPTAPPPARPAATKPAARGSPAPPPTAGRGAAPPPSPAAPGARVPARGTAPGRSPAPVPAPPPAPPPLAESFEALDELMRGTGRTRRRPRAAAPEPYPVRKVPSVGGCLLRLLFLMLLMFIVGIGGLLLFGTAVLRMFGFY